jgi:lysozyme
MADKKTATRLTGAAGAVTALGILAVAVVGQYEGLRLYAYKDVVGVWTACYGETKGIRPGMKFTKEQCDILFIGGLERHERGMRACLKDPDAIPEKPYVAFLSLTYNVGIGGFCKSTVARRANAGDLRGACDALLAWNKAGGRVVAGLVKRRKSERNLCLDGVNGK